MALPTKIPQEDVVAWQGISRLKISPMNKAAWLDLAQHFKHLRPPNFFLAEICYVAALYIDPNDVELLQKWLGVYAVNRKSDATPAEILASAQSVEAGIKEQHKQVDMMLSELRHCVACLEDPKLAL